MHPISDSFCQITCFCPCTGPHMCSLHSSDHSKLSSPILSQAPFPISAFPFPHRKKNIFKIIWNTSLSYTFHFKVKLRRKKNLWERLLQSSDSDWPCQVEWLQKGLQDCSGPLHWAGWAPASRFSEGVLKVHVKGSSIDELCKVFGSTSTRVENGRQKRINSEPLFHFQMWCWNADHLSKWILEDWFGYT